MLEPGAEMSGLMVPWMDGPLELKEERALVLVVEPIPRTPAVESAGLLAVLQAEPEFPLEKSGMMPAVCHPWMTWSKKVFPRPPPHELETRSGAPEQLGELGQTVH